MIQIIEAFFLKFIEDDDGKILEISESEIKCLKEETIKHFPNFHLILERPNQLIFADIVGELIIFSKPLEIINPHIYINDVRYYNCDQDPLLSDMGICLSRITAGLICAYS